MTLRRETIMMAMAIFVLAVTVPFAVVEAIEKGRVYLFSAQFLEELPQRFAGPGRLRFIVQPLVAVLLGVRSGLADVKSGNPYYLLGLLLGAGRRKELLQNGVRAISNLLALGIIMDVVFQLVLYRAVHPGAALLVGPIFICVPYVLSRTMTAALVRKKA